jgi:hypothetical protein
MKKWMIGLMALVLSVVVPAAARAHEGHAHKVMGTVSSISGKNLMVKGTDGKTVMVMLDAKTKITQGTRAVDFSVVKVGDRVVAEGPEQKEMIMAATLKIGEAAPAVAKK